MTSLEKRKLLYWPWPTIPLVLISYLVWWNSLPELMGTHTGWNGKLDGWMSREASLLVSLFGLTTMLLVSTWRVKCQTYISKRLLIRHCAGPIVITAGVVIMLLRNLR